MSSSYLDVARRALAAGLCPVPVARDGSKRPALASWTQWQHELPTDEHLLSTAWFGEGSRTAGIGLICGQVSGGLEMLELEGRAVHVLDEMDDAMSAAGIYDAWCRVIDGYQEDTPSGGVHYLYRCTAVAGNTKIACNAQREVMIETRGEGGFVVVAPTSGAAHPSGKPWTIVSGSFETIATITPAERTELHRLLATFDQTPTPERVTPDHVAQRTHDWQPHPTTWADDERPGDRYNRETSWHEILEPKGWLHLFDRGEVGYWRRPGKTDGISATTNALGTDRLKVFSTSTEFATDGTYDKLGVLAAFEHGGNIADAARSLRGLLVGSHPKPVDGNVVAMDADDPRWNDDASEPSPFVIWPELWADEHEDEAWLAYPLIPEGRQLSLYAPAKTGKSLVALDLAASLATNRPIFGDQHGKPDAVVLYLDYEMTRFDLRQRLDEMGYSENDDLSRLKYALLPQLPPLDTAEGGRSVLELAVSVSAALVIIDTTSRAISGDENDANTFREFYRHCGSQLKSAGIAMLRTDHAGKSAEMGQRGSSGKNDDVDAVWLAVGVEGGIKLTRKMTRINYGPEIIGLRIDREPLAHHMVEGRMMFEAGAKQVADDLAELGAPLDISGTRATTFLKAMGRGKTKATVLSGVKFRQTNDNGWTMSEGAETSQYDVWCSSKPGSSLTAVNIGENRSENQASDLQKPPQKPAKPPMPSPVVFQPGVRSTPVETSRSRPTFAAPEDGDDLL